MSTTVNGAHSNPKRKLYGTEQRKINGINRSSMTQYRVFLGAPSREETRQSSGSYQWQNVSSEPWPSASVIFPPATLEAASRRVSLIYQGVIFKEPDEREHDIGSERDQHGEGLQGKIPV